MCCKSSLDETIRPLFWSYFNIGDLCAKFRFFALFVTHLYILAFVLYLFWRIGVGVKGMGQGSRYSNYYVFFIIWFSLYDYYHTLSGFAASARVSIDLTVTECLYV